MKPAIEMKRTMLLVVLAAACLGPARAADPARGAEIVQQQCAACHGKDLNSPIDKSYPRLAGQYVDYLEKALLDYQTGGRKNPVMGGMSKPLSRDDIRNVSAYIASLPGTLNNTKR
jgi:cytochrome c553